MRLRNMLKICLVFSKSEPQYAYKLYAYKKSMYFRRAAGLFYFYYTPCPCSILFRANLARFLSLSLGSGLQSKSNSKSQN